jgi:hypothetical protein
MKYKKTIIGIAFIFTSFVGLHAQENTVASGGEAIGSAGTLSYSIGQVVYTTITGANGSLAQGVQQSYEISTTNSINESAITLEMSVYPNPTTDYLTLKVEASTGLSYQLFDLQGKVIENKKVNSNSTTIKMESLPIATYFLNITENNLTIKTFKIIKK